jgi:3-hydroxyisobutyrate dehydrogenase
MALNLRRAEVDLLVFDAASEASTILSEHGAEVASNVAELTRRSDVIFMSLPGPVQIEEVVFDQGGILDNARPGLALFDLSTSSPTLARRINDALAEKGASMLDAPVSGGPAGAASRDLVVWVGGDRAVFDANLHLLEAIAKAPHYVGGIGTATVTKLAHNMMGYLFLLSMAETFSLAVKAGADPLHLWEAMRLGQVGRRSPLDMLVNQFLPGKYETPAFALKLAHKDVRLATELGRELGVPMRLANLTMEEMTEGLARGFGDQDSRSYLKLQLERAGVEIAVDEGQLADLIARSDVRP